MDGSEEGKLKLERRERDQRQNSASPHGFEAVTRFCHTDYTDSAHSAFIVLQFVLKALHYGMRCHLDFHRNSDTENV
jgi:hypothetical protein